MDLLAQADKASRAQRVNASLDSMRNLVANLKAKAENVTQERVEFAAKYPDESSEFDRSIGAAARTTLQASIGDLRSVLDLIGSRAGMSRAQMLVLIGEGQVKES